MASLHPRLCRHLSLVFPFVLFVRVEFESEFRRACYAEFEVPGTPFLFAMVESLQKIWGVCFCSYRGNDGEGPSADIPKELSILLYCLRTSNASTYRQRRTGSDLQHEDAQDHPSQASAHHANKQENLEQMTTALMDCELADHFVFYSFGW